VDRGSGYFAGISILDPATGAQSNLTEDWVLAFFWSPDGSRIAYVTPSDGGEGSIRWAVVSVADRDTFYLADFRPTQQQIIQYMFFDQYTQSHSPWSPDGTALVFSGTLGFQLIRSELPFGPDTGVYVVSAARRARPVEVAKGTFGIWRPSL
jgi:TolB protein